MSQRDPARIDSMLEAIRRQWEVNPDLRLAQLVFNAARSGLEDTEAPLPAIDSRLYNVPDDLILRGLEREH